MEHVEKSQEATEAGVGHVGGRLDVVTRQIAELTLDPKNPRLHRADSRSGNSHAALRPSRSACRC
jgi:hypothetical protein